MSERRELAKFLVGLKMPDVPEKVRETARLCVLDSVGAALGAADHPQVRRVTEAYLGIAGKDGAVSIWGQGKKAPLSTAVFLNAMMGHTLELDDVHTNSKTHIGTVVVPAAWSLAEYLGSTGEEFLLAVICGYETMSRIGMAFGVSSHRNKGWHVTATAGTFGAAAACGKLLGLDEDRMVYALGLAGSQSFGLWAFLGDGASCKVLNPARASADGFESALLAQAGMTGPEHVLTAKDGGLLEAMSDQHDVTLVDKDLGKAWQILEMDNKPYPCCRSTHCAIDGALALREKYGVTAGDVDHIRVDTYLVGNKQCGMSEGSRNPKNPVDAKFSTPFCVASAILYGQVSLAQFTQESIEKPAVRELLQKVEVATCDRFTEVYPDHWGCHITITCKDGRVLEEEVTDASGSVSNPLTAQQVVQKASGLIRETQGDRAEALADAILKAPDLEKLPQL